MNIKHLDRLMALATIVLGAWVLFAAFGYGYWVRNAPGPGLFPMIASVGMILLGIVNLLRSLIGREVIDNELDIGSIARSLAILAIVIGFLLTVHYLGMLIGSAIMIFLIGLVIEEKRTAKFFAILGAIACAFPVMAHFLFAQYLNVPLITGVWGL